MVKGLERIACFGGQNCKRVVASFLRDLFDYSNAGTCFEYGHTQNKVLCFRIMILRFSFEYLIFMKHNKLIWDRLREMLWTDLAFNCTYLFICFPKIFFVFFCNEFGRSWNHRLNFSYLCNQWTVMLFRYRHQTVNLIYFYFWNKILVKYVKHSTRYDDKWWSRYIGLYSAFREYFFWHRFLVWVFMFKSVQSAHLSIKAYWRTLYNSRYLSCIDHCRIANMV